MVEYKKRKMKPATSHPEPQARVQELKVRLSPCRLCPRNCQVLRSKGQRGICGILDQPLVASYGPHHGEEDCLRGWAGSGTIFFSGCNLGCVFCQNWDISHLRYGYPVSTERLAAMMLELQDLGCHNINWVTPTHVIPMLIEALLLARERGLHLPVVYNCGGYESVETLRLLEGWIDIYMPDFKFWNPETAKYLCGAPDYPERARTAIREMHRQVGDLVIDEKGLARHGLLIRHLVMPGLLEETREILRWIATELSRNTYVNIMAQYRPEGGVLLGKAHPRYAAQLQRRLTREEYQQALTYAREVGLWRLD